MILKPLTSTFPNESSEAVNNTLTLAITSVEPN